ncbi:MAG: VWA domain-containing protein [Chloracidobacterium sp.]|nr:VWA domain-containing protein [Chloracidobacterium sp.]
MQRTPILSLMLLTAATLTAAQSGRRPAATPTPAAAETIDPSEYSESRPMRSRSPNMAARPAPTAAKPAPNAKPVEVESEDQVIKVETDLITIPVSVFDRSGLYVPNIRRSEFKIFEDGVEQEIAYFGTSDKPFTVVLLLDTSLSTNYRIEEIREAARAFVDQLKIQDSVMVIEFDRNVSVLTDVTNDRQRIYKAIGKADFGMGTSLYDAVDQVLRRRLSRIEGRKAVVLFTDGVDTTSRKAGYDTTLTVAEEADAMVFPIYYDTFEWNRQGAGSPFPVIGSQIGTRPGDYALGRKYLQELADYTGGRVFRPESTPGGLTAAFEGIAEELRRQYNVGYIPAVKGVPGQRKQIRVRVNRPNLIIRARDSYIVADSPSSP